MMYRFYKNHQTGHKCKLYYTGDTYRTALERYQAERDDGVILGFPSLNEGERILKEKGYELYRITRELKD